MCKSLEWRRQIFTGNHHIYYNSLIKIFVVAILLLFMEVCTNLKPLYETGKDVKTVHAYRDFGVLTYEVKHLKRNTAIVKAKKDIMLPLIFLIRLSLLVIMHAKILSICISKTI